MHEPIDVLIGKELSLEAPQVKAAIRLFDEGASVPFVAFYKKDATQGLSSEILYKIWSRWHDDRDLEVRRDKVRQALREQDAISEDLNALIANAKTKTELDDVFLPYRPKRRSKGLFAKEAGLAPLVDNLLQQPDTEPKLQAAAFLNPEKNIHSVEEALEGAKQLLIERFIEEPAFLAMLRENLWQHATLQANVKDAKKCLKYKDYTQYSQPLNKVSIKQTLALFRGRQEQALSLSLVLPTPLYGEELICSHFAIAQIKTPTHAWLMQAVRLAWPKVLDKVQADLFHRLREKAEDDVIQESAKHLRAKLFAAPAGKKITLGLDCRTGLKAAVIDGSGQLLDYAVVMAQNDWFDALVTLAYLLTKHHVELISMGDGPRHRDAERLLADLLNMYPDIEVQKIQLSDAGAAAYAHSAAGIAEFPDVDAGIRSAVSIARRLQNPLYELAILDPKFVVATTHLQDVNQARLRTAMAAVIEDCLHQIGVDLNQATSALLSLVSGFNDELALNVVQYRDQHGPFRSRETLKQVPGMDAKRFAYAAGFLKIEQGDNPLDATRIHPDAYAVVQHMAADLPLSSLLCNHDRLKALDVHAYVNDNMGEKDIQTIVDELLNPGNDPRPTFKTVIFKQGLRGLSDLKKGMVLEGLVGHVTHFGAFVNIGIGQDGLVHVSELNHRFVHDPSLVVKTGDIVKVKVIDIDAERRRFGLTMKLEENPSRGKPNPRPTLKQPKTPAVKKEPLVKQRPILNTSMADALLKLKQKM